LRKKLSHVMLIVLVLFLSLVAVQERHLGSASTVAKVFVDPPETKDTGKGIGSTFTVKVNVSNVEELYGWQINMTYNPAVLNTTAASIVEGPFLKDVYPTQLITKKVNNALGTLLVTYMLKLPYPPNGVSGNGTLVSITFKVKALERATLLRLVTDGHFPTKLNTIIANSPFPIEHTTEDGIFDNRVGNAPPVAGFSADYSAANMSGTVKFDASASHDPDAWLVSYRWYYGDGSTEIYMREPLKDVNLTALATHVYSSVGTFTVTLTVTDSNGATDTAETTAFTICRDIAVTGIKSPRVAIRQNETMTIHVNVSHTGFPYNGAFDVTLYGNETFIDVQTVVDLASEAETILDFTWNTTGFIVGKYKLTAIATTVEGDYNTTNNAYIDGWVTVALTNTYVYSVLIGGQTFLVSVESTSTISGFNFIPTEKKIDFEVAGKDNSVGFSNVTIPADLLGGPYTVLFDGSPITPEPRATTNGTHTFLYFTYVHSVHTVEITGTTVATPPVAVFTTSTKRAIAGTLITFNATDSYDPDGTIETYYWDFDDGTTATDKIVDHSYSATGNYTVTLTVKDNKQLANSTQDTIRVVDYPQASFTYTPASPLQGETIQFNASASQPNGGEIISYKWDFGDGTTATGVTYTHTYNKIGNYTVVLNVTDSEELWDTETRTVTISIHNIAIKDLTATPNTAQIGQQISISVKIINEGNFTETLDLSAYYNSTLIEKKTVTNLAPADSETITITWNTANVNPATYELKTVASTVPEEATTDDNTLIVTVTVTKKTSQLTLEAFPATLTLGEETTISGTAIPAYAGISITIQHRLIDAPSWTTIGTATTDSEGHYTYNWKPEKAGTYEVKANWPGDASTLQSESNTQQITVQEPPTQINMLYIAGAAIAIVLIATTVYLLKIRRPKSP